jgi:hypothetical protein
MKQRRITPGMGAPDSYRTLGHARIQQLLRPDEQGRDANADLLSVPSLIRSQITACRAARSAAPFVGGTIWTRAEVHKPSWTRRISAPAYSPAGRRSPRRPAVVARVGPSTPTRARRLIDASVDPTDARNAPVFVAD